MIGPMRRMATDVATSVLKPVAWTVSHLSGLRKADEETEFDPDEDPLWVCQRPDVDKP